MRNKMLIDMPLIGSVGLFLTAGICIFVSAALGLMARGEANIPHVIASHLGLGVGLGLIAAFVAFFVEYRLLRRYSIALYVFGLLVTLLVFVPGIGFEHGGGTRWIHLFGQSFQPSELMKITTLIMTAAYFANIKNDAATMKHGLLGWGFIVLPPSIILILQPDLGTLGVIIFSSAAVYLVAGARLRHLVVVAFVGITLIAVLALLRPYVWDRIETFINPTHGALTQSYQLRQSLIAVGSGQLTGRGLGQGIQKYTYLPEPMGDSVFAVAAEEFGFIGAALIVCTLLFVALRSYFLAAAMSDRFAVLLTAGIATYLVLQGFINIAAIIGIAPLTGIPLTFVSQGGSAMLTSLFSFGLLLALVRGSYTKHV